MGETKVQVVEPGDMTSEVLEAIALIAGTVGGMCFIPCEVGGDVTALRRELVGILDGINIEVTHHARYTTDGVTKGTTLYEGIAFTHKRCMARVKLGFQPVQP